ncbi:hypothetical protein SLEP1_g4640 [Rubroshorea leprosula]|uniref:NADH dehydrogenase subunit 4L n=1 Tax=Rubroshorea leprosula TaxID=152421 RepID=A0AAV5HY67_9ROSI|nr:hypothetical protein SLEP1_g4640 [Rubroshorea leprosula]
MAVEISFYCIAMMSINHLMLADFLNCPLLCSHEF